MYRSEIDITANSLEVGDVITWILIKKKKVKKLQKQNKDKQKTKHPDKQNSQPTQQSGPII